MKNSVFIATSLDGFIADADHNIDFLSDFPNPENLDFGYTGFIDGIDAIVMGRNTLDIILGFDCEWPYSKPVYVLSNSLETLPVSLTGKVQILKGDVKAILAEIHQQGHLNLYIDGGKTIQSFFRADCIDEIIITTIPVLLGEGISISH